MLHTIDGAAFVVCLDDESPESANERANQFLLGGPSNRWGDKSLQVVVCHNGSTALINEHSMLDGDTLIQLIDRIRQAIKEDSPNHIDAEVQNKQAIGESVKEIIFQLQPEVLSQIDNVTRTFANTVTPIEYTHHTYHQLGSSLLRSHRCAPRPCFSIILQLASRLHFGGPQDSCIEPVSLRTFHRGRLDWVQAAIPAVVDFCDVIYSLVQSQGQTSSTEEPPRPFPIELTNDHRALLVNAIKELANVTTNTLRGRGHRNHLLALRQMLRPDEEAPELFKHPAMQLLLAGKMSLGSLEWGGRCTEAGVHRPGETARFWVQYEVRENQ